MFAKYLKILKNSKRSAKKQEEKEFRARLKRLEPTVRKTIETIFVDNEYPLGYENWEEGMKLNKPIARKLLGLYRDDNIELQDVKIINQMIVKTLDDINNAVVDSVQHNIEYVEQKVWGDRKDNVDFKTLESILEVSLKDDGVINE